MHWKHSSLLAFCLTLFAACSRPTASEGPSQAVTDRADVVGTIEPGSKSAEGGQRTAENGGVGAGVDEAPSARRAEVPVASTGLARDTDEVEEHDEAWRLEAVHEQLQRTLSGWIERLENRETLDGGEDWLAAADSVQLGTLAPVDTRVVFRDTRLEVVRRATMKSSLTPPATMAATRVGLLEELERFRAPLGSSREVHGKAKIAGIQRQEDRIETRVHLGFVGHDERQRVQLSTVWNCVWRQDAAGHFLLEGITSEDYERVTAREQQTFRDATEAVLGGEPSYREQLRHGLDHWLDRFETQFGIIPAGYHGIAVGDVNGDGLDDLFVPQAGGVVAGLPNRLYVQQLDGSLRDISRDAGIDWTAETHCGLLVDFDNDGDQDLAVALMGAVVLASNEGSRFELRNVLETNDDTTSMSAADYDLDGDVDLYVCVDYPNDFFASRRSQPVQGGAANRVYHDANNAGRNSLFRNDLPRSAGTIATEADWPFVDVTAETGLDENNRRYSWASCWEDYDDDGDQDLYVSNDFGRNNLYENQAGRFVDKARDAEVEDIASGMSAAWGDANHDGLMDLYVGNMFSSAGGRITYQPEFKAGADEEIRSRLQRFARGNSLFLNRGDRTFADVSVDAGVTVARWAWSSIFVDVNNDGWQDLAVANGYITSDDTGDL